MTKTLKDLHHEACVRRKHREISTHKKEPHTFKRVIGHVVVMHTSHITRIQAHKVHSQTYLTCIVRAHTSQTYAHTRTKAHTYIHVQKHAYIIMIIHTCQISKREQHPRQSY